MRDIRVPDEHFFQTLNHNPQMGIPGSFLGQSSIWIAGYIIVTLQN